MGLETAEWFTLLVVLNIVYITWLVLIIRGDYRGRKEET
jgi:hypothetical protein